MDALPSRHTCSKVKTLPRMLRHQGHYHGTMLRTTNDLFIRTQTSLFPIIQSYRSSLLILSARRRLSAKNETKENTIKSSMHSLRRKPATLQLAWMSHRFLHCCSLPLSPSSTCSRPAENCFRPKDRRWPEFASAAAGLPFPRPPPASWAVAPPKAPVARRGLNLARSLPRLT